MAHQLPCLLRHVVSFLQSQVCNDQETVNTELRSGVYGLGVSVRFISFGGSSSCMINPKDKGGERDCEVVKQPACDLFLLFFFPLHVFAYQVVHGGSRRRQQVQMPLGVYWMAAVTFGLFIIVFQKGTIK